MYGPPNCDTKFCAKIVPKSLNDDQKAHRNEVLAKNDWTAWNWIGVCLIGPQQVTKVEFSNTSLKPNGRMRNSTHHGVKDRRNLARANRKSRQCSSIFFHSRGEVHEQFVPSGVTVNQKYSLEVLGRLRERMMRVRMEIAEGWILWASSRQIARACTHAHSIVSSWISGEKVHSCASVVSLFYRCFTLWFLLVPKIKIENQTLSFSGTWQRSEDCNWHHQDANRSWLPIMLWGVQSSLGEVCCIRGTLFWRGHWQFGRIIAQMVLYRINLITFSPLLVFRIGEFFYFIY
jgi:hypothetical protein